MKKISFILSVILALTIASCEDNTFDLSYDAPLKIDFSGVDNSNIITVGKGVMSYTASIEVNAPVAGIKYFEIYNADPRTGAKGTLLENTSKSFADGEGRGVPSCNAEFTFDNLVENKCIKVVVTDGSGNVFERNLMVKITPSVVFTLPVKMETAENYYGPYFASWLDGRVYMRRDGEKNKDAIDFSLGDVIIETEGANPVPALVNPAERSSYQLLTLTGLQQTRFERTALTKTEYDAITQVNASVIISLPDPTGNAVKIENGRVYLFKTENGKKGLIYISALAAKTGTIEKVSGEWVKNTSYYQVTVTTKVLAD